MHDPGRPSGPPKRPSGAYRAVREHTRRAAEILRRCDHEHFEGRRCLREVGHDGAHRDVDRFEWPERDGHWR